MSYPIHFGQLIFCDAVIKENDYKDKSGLFRFCALLSRESPCVRFVTKNRVTTQIIDFRGVGTV